MCLEGVLGLGFCGSCYQLECSYELNVSYDGIVVFVFVFLGVCRVICRSILA